LSWGRTGERRRAVVYCHDAPRVPGGLVHARTGGRAAGEAPLERQKQASNDGLCRETSNRNNYQGPGCVRAGTVRGWVISYSAILLLGSSSALARRLAATQRPLRLRARGWINKCGCPSLFLFMWALSWSGQGVRASQGLMGQDLLSGHTRALHPFVCRPWFSSFWSSVRALAP
jgi:hypothetical protein